ncbi:lipase maturation factor 1-like [Tubulanus polymorphus]|uniref:lipase maturation factor 1-like n=1 Tax=Tubulanus polymorphus TaxID=672921 RepID=UPI003DA3C872
MSQIRRRNIPNQSTEDRQNQENDEREYVLERTNCSVTIESGSYWLTRIVFLRSLSFIYFIAFLVGLHQNKQLIGKNGLLPADTYLENIKSREGLPWKSFATVPTLMWFVDYRNHLDWWLDGFAYSGLALSAFVFWNGGANIIIMLCLWILYHTIANVGQRWYGFGWESQLLETGFLAAFFCPLFSVKRIPKLTPPPWVVLWGFRWLIFRIMLGAGLIKIRGDKCWRDLTCMNYHYETQPVPNPMAYFMHQEPEAMHKFETLSNHFVELIAPFLLLIPIRPLMITGGLIQILFQAVLIISGNLSFLNWLTILPSICSIDDRFLAIFFSQKPGGTKWQVSQLQREAKVGKRKTWGQYVRSSFHLALAAMIGYLSLPVVQNLLSQKQLMNTSFEPLRIVNTYGAFGSITKERTEIIFQGTYDDPGDPSARWLDYEFKCKPGNVYRRPCLISPYHYRLDWLMWFAAFQNYQYNPWLVHLAAKLLANDPGATSLISHNPFIDKKPPRFIRAQHFRYTWAKFYSKAASKGQWWKRKYIGEYLPAISLDSLKQFLRQMGWPVPRLPK